MKRRILLALPAAAAVLTLAGCVNNEVAAPDSTAPATDVGADKADAIVSGYTCATADAVVAAQEYIGLSPDATMPRSPWLASAGWT